MRSSIQSLSWLFLKVFSEVLPCNCRQILPSASPLKFINSASFVSSEATGIHTVALLLLLSGQVADTILSSLRWTVDFVFDSKKTVFSSKLANMEGSVVQHPAGGYHFGIKIVIFSDPRNVAWQTAPEKWKKGNRVKQSANGATLVPEDAVLYKEQEKNVLEGSPRTTAKSAGVRQGYWCANWDSHWRVVFRYFYL